MKKELRRILDEVTLAFEGVSEESMDSVVLEILNCKGSIICIGAGRMGFALKGFSMRLSHLGFRAFMLGDTSLPRVTENDLIIVGSSTGETPSIKLFAEQAKMAGSRIVLVTCTLSSSIALLADKILSYPPIESGQLMKTYHEQVTWLLYDALAQLVVDQMQLDLSWIEHNHSILE